MNALTPFDRWRSDLQAICGHYDGAPRRFQRDVAGQVLRRNHNGLDVADVSGDIASISRDRDGIRRDESEYIFFILQAAGELNVDHNGQRSVLGPGDCMLFDSTKESGIYFRQHGGHLLSVHLPRQTFLADCENRIRIGTKIDSDHPLSAALRQQFSHLLTGNRTADVQLAGPGLLFEIIRLAFSRPDERFDAGRLTDNGQRFDVALELINRNLGQTCLSLPWLGAQMMLSTRQLQRVFSEQGTSFARVVREKRLKYVVEMLRLQRRAVSSDTICELAFDAGFRDISNFNRAFKAHYGMAPREYKLELMAS